MSSSDSDLPERASAADQLLPYYVYELRDPRENKPFYVGKGTRQRVDSHSEAEENEKGRYISDIKAAGFEVTRVVIARFETEAEAFALEAALIKWVYGFGNLVNRVLGHRSDLIRSHSEKEAGFSTMPLLDVPRPQCVRDGAYTAEQREKIRNNLIEEKLDALYRVMVERLPECSISAPNVDRPQDPCIFIEIPTNRVAAVQVKMQLTGKSYCVNIVPTSREQASAFNEALVAMGRHPSRGNRHGTYTQIARNVAVDDFDAIVYIVRRWGNGQL
jgi:hypothetical protein